MSKRKLRALVEEGRVSGMGRSPACPPLRPAPPRIHPQIHSEFCERIGVSKVDSTVDWAFLESRCLREDLNETAQRVMAVLRPVKLTITTTRRDSGRLSPWRTTP